MEHAKRLYTDKFPKYCKESTVLGQDITHKYQNARFANECIDITLYPYDDPLQHFMKQQSNILTDEVLYNMQKVSVPYWQLHRTTTTAVRYDLMKVICQNSKWLTYIKYFCDYAFKTYPQPLSYGIFDLLRPGNTLFAWSSQENQIDFWLKKNENCYKKQFPRYPCPAPVFRLLHALCYYHSWNVLINFGYQSQTQYSCALYSFHLLSTMRCDLHYLKCTSFSQMLVVGTKIKIYTNIQKTQTHV